MLHKIVLMFFFCMCILRRFASTHHAYLCVYVFVFNIYLDVWAVARFIVMIVASTVSYSLFSS